MTDRRDQGEIGQEESLLKHRALEVFPNAYMTVVSIVQGTALALLVASVHGLLTAKEAAPSLGSEWVFRLPVVVVAHAAVTWVTIAIVFYMYVWFTIVARWTPTWIDSFLPLGLGTGEIAMAALIGTGKQWLASLAITSIVGAIAFASTLIHANSARLTDQTHQRMSWLLRRLALGMLAVAALSLSVCFALDISLPPGEVQVLVLAACIVVTILGVLVVVISERALRSIYEMNRVPMPRVDWGNLKPEWSRRRSKV